MKRRTALLIGLPVATLALGLSACGSDKDSSSSNATTATTALPVTPVTVLTTDVAKAQTFLDDVGCWAGPIDNAMGPETEAAIKEFQQAKGLTVDGQLSASTMTALETAADEGKRVCEAPAASTTTSTAPSSACSEVDDAEILKVLTAGSTDPHEKVAVGRWYCAPDSGGKGWVGGWYDTSLDNDPSQPAITANFIMTTTTGGSLVSYEDMATCTNPPIPASILPWCESS